MATGGVQRRYDQFSRREWQGCEASGHRRGPAGSPAYRTRAATRAYLSIDRKPEQTVARAIELDPNDRPITQREQREPKLIPTVQCRQFCGVSCGDPKIPASNPVSQVLW